MAAVRKMRLVSEMLFNKLMDSTSSPTEKLVSEKEDILGNENIPDDVKMKLYHQTIRQISDNVKEEMSPQPITMPATPGEKQRRESLETFLNLNDISQNVDGRLVIGKTRHTTPYEQIIARLLGKDNRRRILPGITKIQKTMEDSGIPRRYFNQRGNGKVNAVKRMKNENDVMKRLMRNDNTVAKRNGTASVSWKAF